MSSILHFFDGYPKTCGMHLLLNVLTVNNRQLECSGTQGQTLLNANQADLFRYKQEDNCAHLRAKGYQKTRKCSKIQLNRRF